MIYSNVDIFGLSLLLSLILLILIELYLEEEEEEEEDEKKVYLNLLDFISISSQSIQLLIIYLIKGISLFPVDFTNPRNNVFNIRIFVEEEDLL
jgi:hypothetical protein